MLKCISQPAEAIPTSKLWFVPRHSSLSVFFLFISQQSFKAIFKPDLNFLKNSLATAADSTPSVHSDSYSIYNPQCSLTLTQTCPFSTTRYSPSSAGPCHLQPDAPPRQSKHAQRPTQYLKYLMCQMIAY